MERQRIYRQPDWQVVLAILGFHMVFGLIYFAMLPENGIMPRPIFIASIMLAVLGLIATCCVMATLETKAKLKIIRRRGITIPRGDQQLSIIFRVITKTLAGLAVVSLVMGILRHEPLWILGALDAVLYFVALYLFGRDIQPFHSGLKDIEQNWSQ